MYIEHNTHQSDITSPCAVMWDVVDGGCVIAVRGNGTSKTARVLTGPFTLSLISC